MTGGNAGIGSATVRALAAHNPACIYLCARRRSSAEETANSIRQQHPNAQIKVLDLDLSSFDSIKECAAEFNRQSTRLDLLFLNAGISTLPHAVTKDGYEHQFAVNHMGHALLTQLLMPNIQQTIRENEKADARIIVVSSEAATNFPLKSGLALDQMNSKAEALSPLSLYGHSKLANILFAQKLAQLYPSITSTSLHPGLVKTDIWGKAKGATMLVKLMSPILWLIGVTMDEGAKTQLWCATAPTGNGGVQSGTYYTPLGKVNKAVENAQNTRLRDELWQWTNDELSKHDAPGWPEP